MAEIYVFGDSIAHGAVDAQGGWVDRLKQYFLQLEISEPESKYPNVYNLGIDGDTSEDVAMRIDNELTMRHKRWSSSADLCIVAIGTNDSRAKGDQMSFVSSTEVYTANLKKILDIIRKHEKRVLFIGLTPVEDAKLNPCSWGDIFWNTQRLKRFDEAQKSFCEQHDITRIELFEAMLLLPDYKDMLFDGLHPNTDGHRWIYEQIKPVVCKLVEA